MILNVELTTDEIETILVALDQYVQYRKSHLEFFDKIKPIYPEIFDEAKVVETRIKEGQRLYNKIMDRITY